MSIPSQPTNEPRFNTTLMRAGPASAVLAWIPVGIWLMSIVLTAVFVPKHLILMLLYGIVGWLWWSRTSAGRNAAKSSALPLVLASVLLFIPLSNTWVPRIWRDLFLRLAEQPWLSFALPEIVFTIACCAAALAIRSRHRLEPSRLPIALGLAGSFILLGGVVSTLASGYAGVAIGCMMAGVVAPVCLCIAILAFAQDDQWLALAVEGIALGALVPLSLGTISVISAFGFPHSALKLQWIKMNIDTQGSYAVSTFGNSGHMASFVLMMAPLYASILFRSGQRVAIRAVGCAGLGLSVFHLAVTYSRSAMLVGSLTLLLLTIRAWSLRRDGRWIILSASALMLVIQISPQTIENYARAAQGLEEKFAEAQLPPPPGRPAVSGQGSPTGNQTAGRRLPAGKAPGPRQSPPKIHGPAPGAKTEAVIVESKRAQEANTSLISALLTSVTSALSESARQFVGAGDPDPYSPFASDRWNDIQNRPTDTPKIRPKTAGELGITDASAQERVDAMGRGIILAAIFGGWGAGLGTYHLLDPRFTAPHSLLLQCWVEGGLLFLAGIILLILYSSYRTGSLFLRDLLSRPRQGKGDLAFACSLSGSAFLWHGMIAGSALMLIGFTIWGLVFAAVMGISCAEDASVRTESSEQHLDPTTRDGTE